MEPVKDKAMIPTKVHGYLDYMMGLILILLPFLMKFPGGAATWLPVILGVGALGYSMLTDYELGLIRIISMRTHLAIDLFSGILLLVGPWIFGFAEEVFWPFVILGLLDIGAALMTRKTVRYVI